MANKNLIIKTDDKITKYKVYKKVFKSGGGGAVVLPKELVGETVYVEYIVEEMNNAKK